jgi:hypothetical protein
MCNNFHSINIHKQHEIDLKLYTLRFKVGNTLQEHFEKKSFLLKYILIMNPKP